jgi:hypothetical protein
MKRGDDSAGANSQGEKPRLDRRRLLAGGCAALGGFTLCSAASKSSSRLFLSLSKPGEGPPRTLVLLQLTGGNDGLSTVVFAFDVRQSDLPLQVAWPILVSNLAGELLGVGPQQTFDPLPPSSPVDIPIAPDSLGVRVTLPDGSVEQLAPGATGASSVTFVSTRQLGIYRAEVISPPTPSGSPGATPAPATASPAPSAGAPPAGTALPAGAR